MTVARQLGITSWAYRESFPWFTMPAVTDSWTADAKYLDSTGSVGTWGPSKGIIPAVQATGGLKPVYSASGGSANHGIATFDGVDDWMSADALAAKIAGNPIHACTIIQSFKLITSAAFVSPWSFTAASNTATLFNVGPASVTKNWQTNYRDDLGSGARSNADTGTIGAVAGTVVLTTQMASSPLSRTNIRVNGIDAAVTHAGIGPELAQTTLTKFTLGAFRGSTILDFCNFGLRHTVFAPSILTLPQIVAIENFMIAEWL